MITFRKILSVITYPLRRLYDLLHNGQSDIEAVYPESFHPTGAEASLHGSVITGFMSNGMNGH